MKSLVLLLTIAVELSVVLSQLPNEARFYSVKHGAVYASGGTSFNFSCSVKNPEALSMAGDGRIWGTLSSQNLVVSIDPETGRCTEYALASNAYVPAASPNGRYVFFIMWGEVFRRDLLLNTYERVLDASRGTYFSAGFAGSKFVAVASYPNNSRTAEFYTYDSDNNLSLLTTTEYRYDVTPRIIKKCPVPNDVFCYAEVEMMRSTNIAGEVTPLTAITASYQPITDYYTAPWNRLYVQYTLSPFFLEISLTGSPSYPLAQYTTLGGRPTPGVILLDPPTVSIATGLSGCEASFQFKSYNWTTKYIIQTMNPDTQLFEAFYVQTNPLEGPQAITLDFTCTKDTARFRLYFEGDMSVSDPVFSISTTVGCNCTAPVPPSSVASVVPILECIELTNDGPVVHLGYNNLDRSTADFAVGPNNRFSDVENRNQPTTFLPGRSGYYPTTAFSFEFNGTVTWSLSTYTLNINTSDTSALCPTTVYFALSFTSETRITSSDITTIQQNLAEFAEATDRIFAIDWSSASKKRATSTVEIRFRVDPASDGPTPSIVLRGLVASYEQSPATFNSLLGDGRAVVSIAALRTGIEQEGTTVIPVAALPVASVPIVTTPENNNNISMGSATAPTFLGSVIAVVFFAT